jgi:hypothetical protein
MEANTRIKKEQERDSKMAARGRKQKTCLLWNLGETLKTHLVGKTTEKRQNFDSSTPPASSEHLHFTLNGETRRAPGPPVTCAQMAWEDTDKVSLAILPQTTPGQSSIAPWTDQPPPGEKRETE